MEPRRLPAADSMTVVLDLGCHSYPDHPNDESVETLIARFRPSLFYGFDPHPDLIETSEFRGGGKVTIRRAAAWTHDETVGFYVNGLSSSIGGTLPVPCFDLADWLELSGPAVVKMDVEGAEYELLEHLIDRNVHRNIERLLIEWHRPPKAPRDWAVRRGLILDAIRCPVEDWR